MKIRKKEGVDLNISITTDKKNYLNLVKDIKKLGMKYENSSDSDKLDYSLVASFSKLPYMKVKGWCSRVINKNGKVMEVFFCDYDNILYRILEDEVRYLMEEFDMPPFYIFSTHEEKDCNGELYGNYIVICLKKNTFRQVIQMQNDLHCDQAYKHIPLLYRFRTWVLRLGNKGKKGSPQFKEIIGDKLKIYNQEVSQAHLEALKTIYPAIPEILYTNLDGNHVNNLYLTEYNTAST